MVLPYIGCGIHAKCLAHQSAWKETKSSATLKSQTHGSQFPTFQSLRWELCTSVPQLGTLYSVDPGTEDPGTEDPGTGDPGIRIVTYMYVSSSPRIGQAAFSEQTFTQL